MGWNPYTDQKNRAFSGILTSLFPEQTKTLPRILAWSVIFVLDLMICIFGASHFGILNAKWGQLLTFVAIFGGFWLQGKFWYGIIGFFQTRNQLD